MEDTMGWIVNNWEVVAVIVAALVDASLGSIDNAKFGYKGIVLRVLTLIGERAKAAKDHDTSKK